MFKMWSARTNDKVSEAEIILFVDVTIRLDTHNCCLLSFQGCRDINEAYARSILAMYIHWISKKIKGKKIYTLS